MASELERSLSEILSECAAPAALSIFLKTEGLTTCALFYDCVKNIDDLEGKVAARLVPAASSLRDLSVIRTVWRRAKVEAEKALSGSVDAPEDWEIPLNPTTKNALTSKSAAAYGTVFRARKMPCDSLLGRVYREREKQCLTAFPLGRVRSLATSPLTKERQLLGNGIVLGHGVAKGVDLSTTVYGYWLCLSVLLHAYIIVGVDGWCPKQVADDYLDLVEEKLWHPRSPGLAAVADVELQHRLRWVELTRGPEGKTLGEAIKTSMSELAGAWQYGPELSADSGVKRKREEPPKETKDYTIQESKGGVAICHSWNLGKCKDDKCPHSRLHVCDIKGCGKQHRRINHRKGSA